MASEVKLRVFFAVCILFIFASLIQIIESMPETILYQYSLEELSKAVAERVLNQLNHKSLESQVEQQYLTREEVASLCKVKSLSTLWSWNKSGLLVPTSKAGRKPLYLKSDVTAFLEGKRGGIDV